MNIEDENNRINNLSEWYLKEQLDFDKELIEFRYKKIKKYFYGESGLELGPADGQMTKFLIDDFKKLTVVDAASDLLEKINNYDNIVKVNSLFEEYNTEKKFDTIIMEHILEHVENPVDILKKTKEWSHEKSHIIVGVPNANSIHRLVAVKMGLLKNQCDLNDRDLSLGHRRVYTKDSFLKDIDSSGLKLISYGGVFFKPLSNSQIEKNWNKDMIEGFFRIGDDFPDFCAELYAICKI
jgi:2-polyprenyl-3-methyl-5-hydroxy-6-metoxy-1,4-benzoquinol methylase